MIDGPPFSITDAELAEHYGAEYQVKLLDRSEIAGGLKGKVAAVESVWWLQRLKR